MKIVQLAHVHRRALFVLLLLLLLAGLRAAILSPRSVYPAISFARVVIIAQRGDASVQGMLVAVTRPIEQAISTVPDLLRLRSKTVRGASELSLDFRGTADMHETLALVRSRVAQAGLPSDVTLQIERQAPSLFPVLSFNVVPSAADIDDPLVRARLTDWTELELHPRIARLPDCFFVTVQSGDRREYVFEADPQLLAQAGVTLSEVEQTIASSDVVETVGRSASEGLQYQLLVDGRLRTPDELLELAVARPTAHPVRLSQLGRVIETTAEQTTIVTAGGLPGVVVSVFLRDGGKVTDLSSSVSAILAEIGPQVPRGGRIEPVYDQSILVEESVRGVRDAIAIGTLLAIGVIFVFLGDWRLTLVTGLSIPISVGLTLAAFPLMHESLNLMSLGGLAVAIGLIIDDAIVVGENVARKLSAAPPDRADRGARFAAIADGTSEVVGAIVGSSLTTVVVFLPLVLLEGVVGQFFKSLAVALGISILTSMVVALVYSPLCLMVPCLAPRAPREQRWSRALRERYAAVCARAIARPRAVVLSLLVVLVAGLAGLGGLRTGFLPEMDEGGFVLDYSLPVGSSLSETDSMCRRVEAILLETAEVASFSRRTGAELGFFATEQFTGDMLVGLVPRAQRSRSVLAVVEELRHRFAREVPQADVEFVQVMQDTINDLAGNPSPIEVKLLGADYPTLQHAADDVEAALERVPGVVDVKNHVSFGSPEIAWRPNPEAAARIGLSTQDVADSLSMQLLGRVATRIQEGERFIDVRVRYPDAWRAPAMMSPSERSPLFVGPVHGAPAAGMIPLADVARTVTAINENELERENQIPMVRVTAAVEGADLGSVSRAVATTLARLPIDPRVRLSLGGQVESSKEAFTNLLFVSALAAGLVFLLLVAQFRSLRLPLVIFLVLPFGMLGGLHALRATGVALNISSGLGLILLVGLVVKNGIILIEFAQDLARAGASEHQAIVEAASVRLRPILMTTLAAVAGLAPLALALGAGAELQRPLAIAVIGGLLVSTLSTLLVVPLGCAWLGRGRLVGEVTHVD